LLWTNNGGIKIGYLEVGNVYAVGPFPCKSISKIVWKSTKLWVYIGHFCFIEKTTDYWNQNRQAK